MRWHMTLEEEFTCRHHAFLACEVKEDWTRTSGEPEPVAALFVHLHVQHTLDVLKSFLSNGHSVGPHMQCGMHACQPLMDAIPGYEPLIAVCSHS